jgi:predicted Zn-dependent protease
MSASSKTKGLMWFIAAIALGVVFALGLSPLAHVIPWSWEKRLSNALDLGASKEECRYSPQAHELLQRLVKRIYPVNPDDSAFSIDVQIIKNPVVNAYAELGGKISINSGLLKQAESAEEVAGVLAHEIGHVQHRHIMEGTIAHMLTAEGINMIFGGHSSTADWTQYFLNMNFTRSQEAQADEEGIGRLQQAHVDNQAFKLFFERMEKSGSVPAFLSDHPSNHLRSEMVARFNNHGATPIMSQDEWMILKDSCSEK